MEREKVSPVVVLYMLCVKDKPLDVTYTNTRKPRFCTSEVKPSKRHSSSCCFLPPFNESLQEKLTKETLKHTKTRVSINRL